MLSFYTLPPTLSFRRHLPLKNSKICVRLDGHFDGFRLHQPLAVQLPSTGFEQLAWRHEVRPASLSGRVYLLGHFPNRKVRIALEVIPHLACLHGVACLCTLFSCQLVRVFLTILPHGTRSNCRSPAILRSTCGTGLDFPRPRRLFLVVELRSYLYNHLKDCDEILQM